MTKTIRAREPKSNGMRVIDMLHIPLSDIDASHGSNKARLTGINEETVNKFIDIIKSDKYTPEYFVPPVVIKDNDTYKLISGFHRYTAHVSLAIDNYPVDTFYAAVVEFQKLDGKSANYWMNMWMIRENVEESEFVRNPSTIGDVANMVHAMVEKKEIANKKDDIIDAIVDAGIRPSATKKINDILSEINQKMGKHAQVVQGYSQGTKAQFVAQYKKDTNTPKNVISQTFKETIDADYDHRLLDKLVSMYIKNPQSLKNVVVVAHTNGADPAKTRRIRQAKKVLLQRYVDRMRTFIKTLDESGVPFDVDISWVPQLMGEMDTYQEKKELVTV